MRDVDPVHLLSLKEMAHRQYVELRPLPRGWVEPSVAIVALVAAYQSDRKQALVVPRWEAHK